ncbi:MAG TPA: hypothetical protein EYP17_08125 [Candidatus Latescibacteria bacterium]|nr:hypothetical protein [Candidatus Latescibacterota bacterium]
MQVCPGQSRQFWRSEDIYDVPCPCCGGQVEFFKVDVKRTCPHCGEVVSNPKLDLSCAEWCRQAEACLGPVLYGQIMEQRKLGRRRREDLERLLAMVGQRDGEVMELFLRLFEENRDPEKLLDVERLRELSKEDPELVERATRYYSEFRKKVAVS